ncbi:MAG: DUF2782 domain-containing protein [Caldimonas sp.]
MKPALAALLAAGLACLGCGAAHAVDTPPASAASAPTTTRVAPTDVAADAVVEAGEPAVKRTVIDDRSAHIEELRVRGQLQKITVDPKGGAPSYEIILGTGARDISDAVSSTRGAAGKRVWNVFRF